jgi:hypothetical protein
MTETTQSEAELGITNLTYATDTYEGSGKDTYTLIWRAQTNRIALIVDRHCEPGAGTADYGGSLDLYRGRLTDWEIYFSDGTETVAAIYFSSTEGSVDWLARLDDAGPPGWCGGYVELWFQWIQTIPSLDIVQTHEYMLVSVSSGDDSEDFKAVVTPAGSHLHI